MMRPLRLFTRQVYQWRQIRFPGLSRRSFYESLDQAAHQLKTRRLTSRNQSSQHRSIDLSGIANGPGDSKLALDESNGDESNGKTNPPRRCRRNSIPQPQLLWLLTVIMLTAATGQRFYNAPKLDVGTASPLTLRAPRAASVVDEYTTEENRKAARIGAVPVLMIDQAVNQQIDQELDRLLAQGQELRETAGSFPYFDVEKLSSDTQHYLRQLEEWEWRAILEASNGGTLQRLIPNVNAEQQRNPQTERQVDQRLADSKQFQALTQLRTYRRQVTQPSFSALEKKVRQARQGYAEAKVALLALSKTDPLSPYDVSFLALTDRQWQQIRLQVNGVASRILSQGIPPGYPGELLETTIGLHIEPALSSPLRSLTSDILLLALDSNLVTDVEQTRLQAEQAAQAVPPERVTIETGEVIVSQGEEITQADFVLLDYFGLSRRGVNWVGFIGFGALVGGAVTCFVVVERYFHQGLRCRDYTLIFLLTLSTPFLSAVGLTTVSLPAVGLLIGSFYGVALGVTSVGLLAIIWPVGIAGLGEIALMASTVGGFLGGLLAGKLRSREELALLGGVVGLVQAILYLVLTLMLNIGGGLVWYTVLMAALLHGLIGLAWSIVALGISPYLEHVFDLVTTIRLAELSNPNRPLLKRLALEAPGTFQHTLFVATLAEAAAQDLGCNVELVRAGTLYHDIGKMHDPLGFIENQMGGPNKHDDIANPWESATIIKKHVSEGLVMARKHRLPREVRAFIPEHQGAMRIAYFYHQAKKQAEEDGSIVLNEADFRYDGPIPQSRETGIVMLADSCEAALRSLKDATPEQAFAMVNKILRARWKDNQLIDSGLTREEMAKIAEIFVRVWQQFNHQRIPYPKLALGAK